MTENIWNNIRYNHHHSSLPLRRTPYKYHKANKRWILLHSHVNQIKYSKRIIERKNKNTNTKWMKQKWPLSIINQSEKSIAHVRTIKRIEWMLTRRMEYQMWNKRTEMKRMTAKMRAWQKFMQTFASKLEECVINKMSRNRQIS